jgi:hypothetical protein
MAEADEKVIITNRAHAGQEMILPEVGKVQLTVDGDTEVPSFVATQLLELGQGWSVKGDANNTSEELKEALKKMGLEDMISLAVKAGIDPELYKKMKVSDVLMRRFLLKNMDPNKLA